MTLDEARKAYPGWADAFDRLDAEIAKLPAGYGDRFLIALADGHGIEAAERYALDPSVRLPELPAGAMDLSESDIRDRCRAAADEMTVAAIERELQKLTGSASGIHFAQGPGGPVEAYFGSMSADGATHVVAAIELLTKARLKLGMAPATVRRLDGKPDVRCDCCGLIHGELAQSAAAFTHSVAACENELRHMAPEHAGESLRVVVDVSGGWVAHFANWGHGGDTRDAALDGLAKFVALQKRLAAEAAATARTLTLSNPPTDDDLVKLADSLGGHEHELRLYRLLHARDCWL